jgi:hypothetical protein
MWDILQSGKLKPIMSISPRILSLRLQGWLVEQEAILLNEIINE